MKKTLAMLLMLVPALMHAHPGHGVGAGHEVLHYIFSPYHMGLAIVLAILVMVLIKAAPRLRRKT